MPGAQGGGPGDLYVDIHVKPDDFFERHGDDLVCNVPITFPQAALGATIEVPTLTGKTEVKIKRGTQSGQAYRIAKLGLPGEYGNGDLIVQVQIEIPTSLAKEQEELIRKLAELDETNVNPKRQSFLDKMKSLFT